MHAGGAPLMSWGASAVRSMMSEQSTRSSPRDMGAHATKRLVSRLGCGRDVSWEVVVATVGEASDNRLIGQSVDEGEETHGLGRRCVMETLWGGKRVGTWASLLWANRLRFT